MAHSDLVQSVARAAAILEKVAQSQSGLTLREVCDALGLKLPTAHNLIRTLIANGLLARSARPVRYRLGPAVGQLAGAYQNHRMGHRDVEEPRLADTQEPASQATPDLA